MDNSQEMHPILKQMQPSTEQKLPVQSRGLDVVVSAGAGTGKTRTLVARFLGLLADGVPLRAIVAITFTVKAAREMRNRIRSEIRTYLSACQEDTERQPWLTLYDRLDAARISTIHSLAAEILRQHPAELGLDPRFELLEETQIARLKSQAVEASLNWAGEDTEAALLFTVFGSWKLRQIISELLEKRLDVAQVLEETPLNPWQIWLTVLQKPIREFVEDAEVVQNLDSLLNLENDGTMARAESAGDQLVEDLRFVNAHWREIKRALHNQDWIEVSQNLGTLGKHLKQKGRTENWSPANPKKVIKCLQDRYQAALGGKYDLDLETDRELAEKIIPQFNRIFQFAVQWYAQRREQVNGLDFDDLEEGVIKLFREHPEVAKYWQNQMEYVLVDEYQDTNARQRLLINTLCAGEGELFIVGDAKQSIYRFRGADVSVFRAEQERIGSCGKSWKLSTSYRAHEKLVTNLNQLLGPILGEETGIPYRVPFSPLESGRVRPPARDVGPYLELHLVAGTKSAGAGLLAAKAVAARLIGLVNDGGEYPDRSRLNYGDIAVLCRASSSFSDFEIAFELAGIPYLTIAGQGFYDRPEIRDILNGLHFISDPDDDLATAGMLRSPVVGIADDQLYLIRSYQIREGIPSLYQAARQYAADSDAEWVGKLTSFLDLSSRFIALSGRISAGELLADYIAQSGYVAALIYAGQYRAAENVKKLVREAQNSGTIDLTEFLETINQIRSVAVREGEAPAVLEGSVQIMTVHQAKGLEFPIVVLGDAAKRDPIPRSILLDQTFGIVLPYKRREVIHEPDGKTAVKEFSSLAYDLAKAAEKAQDQAESDRLLYVAATRSEEMLIVSGAVGNPTKSKQLPGLDGWLGQLARPLGLDDLDLELDQEGSQIHNLALDQNGIQAELAIYEPFADIDFRQPDRNRIQIDQGAVFESTYQTLIRGNNDRDQFKISEHPIIRKIYRIDNDYMPSIMVGRVVHRALEAWKFPSDGEEEFLTWTIMEFKNAGFHAEKAIQDGYQKTRKILERFQEHELFQRMDSADILKHEVHFSVLGKENTLQVGSIDALFRESKGWCLVEFKTDEIKDTGDYQQIIQSEDYLDQVAGYLAAAEKLLGERPDPILCFLNYQGGIYLETSLW